MAGSIVVFPSDDRSMSSPEHGLKREVLATSQQMMLVRHKMDAGWVGVLHSHPHEQMVYMVSGRIRFETPEGAFNVGPGDSFIVPGSVPHQASALEPCEVLDIFTPHREDYLPTEPEL